MINKSSISDALKLNLQVNGYQGDCIIQTIDFAKDAHVKKTDRDIER